MRVGKTQTAKTALIVDDCSATAALFQHGFGLLHIESHIAPNVRSASKLLHVARRFDAAVIDIHLPDALGNVVLREMRADAKHAAAKIVIITADLLLPMTVVHEVFALGSVIRFGPFSKTDIDFICRSLL